MKTQIALITLLLLVIFSFTAMFKSDSTKIFSMTFLKLFLLAFLMLGGFGLVAGFGLVGILNK